MNIYDFTIPELERIKALANFTFEEAEMLQLRSQNIPLEKCAEKMNISMSTACRINKKMKSKIIRVC